MSTDPLLISTSSSNELSAVTTSFDVTIIGATDLPKVGRVDWNDEFFVKLRVDGKIMRATKAIRSHKPIWNKSFTLRSTVAKPQLILEVHDKRRFGPDELVGSVSHIVDVNQNEALRTFNEVIVSAAGKCSVVSKIQFTVKIKTNEDPIEVAGAAIVGLKAPGILRKVGNAVQGGGNVVRAVKGVSDQLQSIETIASPLVKNLAIFVNLVTELSKVHPYAQAAWGIVSLAYKVYDRQRQIDNNVIELFSVMNSLYARMNNFRKRKGLSGSEVLDVSEDVLLRVAQQTMDCSYFIQEYCDSSFTERLAHYIFKSAGDKIARYKSVFENMEKEFERNVFDGTYITSTFIWGKLDNLDAKFDLEKLPIVTGASLIVSTESDKYCLPGTRVASLLRITDWINMITEESKSQRVLLLTGLAGSGKSTIAHTIASRFKAIGRLGASFAFSRQIQSHRVEQLFPHIARLIADLDGAVMKALAEVISSNTELLTVTDPRVQFKELLVKVLKNLKIVGPIAIVIDAIDEASDGTYEGAKRLADLVSAITDLASELPPNIRIVITSRPEPNILSGAKGCREVVHMDLNRFSATDDVLLYVRARLLRQPGESPVGIREEWCLRIAEMSQGLFYWAAVACNDIVQHTVPKRAYDRIVSSGTNVQRTGLLDSLHLGILKEHFGDSDSSADFVSVMSFILALQEPLPASILCNLWEAAGRDLVVLDSVLSRIRSLLDGIDDVRKNIQLSHTSFRDFMTDKTRSGDAFFVEVTAGHEDLILACLRVLNVQLSFNICNLESSHMLNKDIPNLDIRVSECISPECSYACRCWAQHFKYIADPKKIFSATVVQNAFQVFLTKKLLFWLEVLSLLDEVPTALPSMSVLTSHLSNNNMDRLLENIVPPSLPKDAYDFIQLCAPAATLSAPHIYLSALPFVPPTSAIFELYGPRFPRILKVVDAASVLKTTAGVRMTIYSPGARRVAVSPDGSLIAAAITMYDIIMFDFHTGKRVSYNLRGHEGYVEDLRFSADSMRLVSCSRDRTIRLWDVRTEGAVGSPLRGHTDDVNSVAWCRDGKHVVSGSDDCTIRAWDTSAGTQIWCIKVGYYVFSVAYSPDGSLVAAAVDNGITLWHSINGTPVGALSGHTSQGSSVVFSPDGTQIASGSFDKSIRLWDVETRESVSEPLEGHTDWLWAIAFSPDGTSLASVSEDRTLRLWDLGATGPVSGRVLGSTHSRSVAFSRDGAYVVTDSRDSITVWDAGWSTISATENTENTSTHRIDEVGCLAFSPSGSQIFSGCYDGTVRIWDSTTGRAVGKPLVGHPGEVTAVAISPDGALIVSGSEQTLFLWEMTTLKRIGYSLAGHDSTVKAICVSEDGERILSCSYSELVIWDVAKRTSWHPDPKFTWKREIYPFVLAPAEGILAGTSHYHDHVQVWDAVSQGSCYSPWVVKDPRSISVSPDGSQIVIGHRNGEVSMWDLSGNLIQLFKEHRDMVRAVTFCPDGEYVASGSDDSTIRITNVESGKISGYPIQCGNWVMSLAFSADGARLASGLSNGHVRIWDVSSQSLQSHYAGHLLFSYNIAHVMPTLDLPFQQSSPLDGDIWDYIRVNSNGFVVANANGRDRLLFWVPAHLQNDLLFLRRCMLLQIGSPVQLDLSQFAHGKNWASCCSPPSC